MPPSRATALPSRAGPPLLAGVLLLGAAIYNGFPLLFSDSGEYFGRSIVRQVPEYRTFGYSAWLALSWPRPSLWAGVVTQSLLLGALLWWLVRVVAPGLSLRAAAVGAALMLLLTSAPWVAGQVMPDVFAPITIVGVFLVVFHWGELSRPARALCVLAVAFGVTTHATHLWLALGLLAVYAAFALARERGLVRGIVRAASALAVGAVCLVALNAAQTGQLFFSRGGHVYLTAHLLDTGLAQRLLRAECPDGGYALCPYQAQLNTDAARFIWNKDVNVSVLGGWTRSNGEASQLLRGVVRRYPLEYAASLVTYTARQFAALDSFDGLVTYADKGYVADFVSYYLPGQYADFLAAAQQRGAFTDAPALPAIHAAVFWLAALAGGTLLFLGRRRPEWAAGGAATRFHVTVWLALAGNAALCANVSGVFDRYQTRLAWLLPLAVALCLARVGERKRHSAQVGLAEPSVVSAGMPPR